MIKDNNKNKQHEYNPMTELELTKLAEKIVAKMMRLKTVEDWFKHMAKTKLADKIDYEELDLTEEQWAVGQIAKLMTLLNMFQEDEEYEKCSIVKRRLDIVNAILKNIQRYEEEKTKQQESKILGQKQVKRKENNKANAYQRS